jgi:hypothetical protein
LDEKALPLIPCENCLKKCPYKYNGWMAYERCYDFIRWVNEILEKSYVMISEK